ncbi:hypothetical protein ACRQ5Q_43730 (plasmid) [Bradyrhizobium sp. PMVTL-01]|uniref:hypothetical protein n=1 Tax=Bradyrhizobium sp. PMVTL-01 TaxID=3434999 RepID=UPI003F7030C8
MITFNIEVILIVTGALTATMLVQFIAPSWVLHRTFGEIPAGAASMVLARHWGLLLFCVGALLVRSAFDPAIRQAAVLFALVEKAVFAACVLGTPLRQRPTASMMAIGDALMAVIYALYLVGL